jgi:hypothetical protein
MESLHASCVWGVTILKQRENKEIHESSRRNLLEDEVSFDRFGSYLLLGFSGIILISSSIPLSPYINMDLSWERIG